MKKKFSVCFALLVFYVIFYYSDIFSAFSGLANLRLTFVVILSTLCSFVLGLIPLALLILLIVNRSTPVKDAFFIVLIIGAAAYGVRSLLQIRTLFAGSHDMFLYYPVRIAMLVKYVILGLMLLFAGLHIRKGEAKAYGFMKIFGICFIIAVCTLFQAFSNGGRDVSVAGTLVDVLAFTTLPLAIFALPKTVLDFDASHTVPLSRVIIAAVVAVLCLVIPFGAIGNGGGSSSVGTAVCKSCGRTFAAGDSAGNYMNIARTGMCNNCYGNYNWGKDFIGR